MLLHEYGEYQIIKLRHEEMIRKAENAWMLEELKQESFIQKTNGEKQTNCGCVCVCC